MRISPHHKISTFTDAPCFKLTLKNDMYLISDPFRRGDQEQYSIFTDWIRGEPAPRPPVPC